jgi:hypothetical protein
MVKATEHGEADDRSHRPYGRDHARRNALVDPVVCGNSIERIHAATR